MPNAMEQNKFDEYQHALLFAWIAKAIVEKAGEERGESIIRKAVRRYGEQRGRRMALRAQTNKHTLSMANYIGYSEYRPTPGVFEMKTVAKTPDCRWEITQCPWHKAWKENGLLNLGSLYCLEVDHALVRGFNPELRLDQIATLTTGAAKCDFIYHDAYLTLPNYLLLGYRRMVHPGLRAVLPWDYHVGHLFATFEKVAIEELGKEGQEAIHAGLGIFTDRYGEEAREKILASRAIDYEQVPTRRYKTPSG